ncbi:hypothetical protein ARMSODRAFT_951131 [Armillaria solidipes]|uniref:Uncharacterized protein n=1 Tax=Armillaria solidipes TaxID=1076256 RepID=A0A2H3C1A5_9AGAR|nr:hypothetical protein ARMSODRAFT_951131 [Armillaria solidipes]
MPSPTPSQKHPSTNTQSVLSVTPSILHRKPTGLYHDVPEKQAISSPTLRTHQTRRPEKRPTSSSLGRFIPATGRESGWSIA